ncbi:hypothetical protein ACLOJK_008174 [Asimina triloba]
MLSDLVGDICWGMTRRGESLIPPTMAILPIQFIFCPLFQIFEAVLLASGHNDQDHQFSGSSLGWAMAKNSSNQNAPKGVFVKSNLCIRGAKDPHSTDRLDGPDCPDRCRRRWTTE